MKSSQSTFNGFSPRALKFLAGLAKNNSKEWFDAHRDEYELEVVAPALLFIEAMGLALRKIAPGVAGEPRVNGSLFRIHKDTRFSKDKTPYKTHVGIRLRDPDTVKSSACTAPVFYVELNATRLRLGVGIKAFDKETLEAYRQAILDKKLAGQLGKMLKKARGDGLELIGDTLKRVPPGFDDRADPDLIRRKGLAVLQTMPIPDAIHSKAFVSYCLTRFKPYAPLYQALEAIQTGPGR